MANASRSCAHAFIELAAVVFVLAAVASCAGTVGPRQSGANHAAMPAMPAPARSPSDAGALDADATVAALEPAPLGALYDGCTPRTVTTAAPPTRRESLLVVQSNHAVEVSTVAWSPDGSLVATSDGYDVRLWDPATGELRGVISDLLSPGARLAFGPDGATLAVAAFQRIAVWDLATSSVRSTLATDGHVKALAWSRTGDALAAVTTKGSTYVWNTRDGTRRAGGTIVLPTHWYTVDDAMISADGGTVLVRGLGAVAKAAFPAGGAATPVVGDEARELPAQRSLVARSCDGRTWDPDSIRRRTHLPIGAQPAFATASHDASRVLAIREDGLAVVWDTPGRQLLSTLQGTPLRTRLGGEALTAPRDTFDFSEDGSRVQGISVAPGGHGWEFQYTVRVWSARTGRLESTRTVAGSGVVVRPSRDGSKRAFLSSPYYLDPGYRLFLGGVPDALVASLAKDPRLVFDVAWDNDGGRLSITRARTSPASRDDVIHERWDVASGRRLSSAAATEEKIEGRFVVEDTGTSPQRIRITRKADAAWLDLTPLFGPRGLELVIESSGGAIDVAPSSSSLVRFRVGPDLRTSATVGVGDPRGRDLEPSLARDFLR